MFKKLLQTIATGLASGAACAAGAWWWNSGGGKEKAEELKQKLDERKSANSEAKEN